MDERFWARVTITTITGCWTWKGSRNQSGYGTCSYAGHVTKAHRVAYELAHGPIPTGLHIRHRCHNRGCVNPWHLMVGTHQDNMADMVEAGRQPAGEKNGRHKLRADQVLEIRALYGAGWKQKDIASTYGLSHQAVSFIVTRRTWPDLW